MSEEDSVAYNIEQGQKNADEFQYAIQQFSNHSIVLTRDSTLGIEIESLNSSLRDAEERFRIRGAELEVRGRSLAALLNTEMLKMVDADLGEDGVMGDWPV